MHARRRGSILSWWGRSAAAHPFIALGSALLVAGGAAALAVWKLDFRTDRSELISMERDWNRRYAEYKQNFPRWDDITIAIEGEPDDRAIDDIARAVAERLRQDPRIAAADAGFDAREAPRMYQLAPYAEFVPQLFRIESVRAAARSWNVNAALMHLAVLSGDADADERSFRAFMEPFVAAVRGEEAEFKFAEVEPDHWQSFVSASGRIRTIFVQIDDQAQAHRSLGATIDWMRAEVSGVIESVPNVTIAWGITGIPAIEADETAQSMRDSTRASILAFVLLAALLVTAFRGVVVPLLATLALLIALCWAFGWAALAVGHLQILSVFFTVMFLGIGMDFAVHLAARYELVRDQIDVLPEASARVFEGVGPSILTGALTTAASFATIAFTDFLGAAELGLICAGGIILCVICVPTVFPAMLALTGRWKAIVHARPQASTARFRGLVGLFTRRPLVTLASAVAITAVLAWLGATVRYDPNILNLQPAGTESVDWEKRLVEENQTTAWAGLLPVRPADLHEMVWRLRPIGQVEGVSAMGMLVLGDREQHERRTRHVALVAEDRAASESAGEGHAALRDLLEVLARGIRDVAPQHASVADWIDGAIEQASALPIDHLERAWLRLNESFLEKREQLGSFGEAALRTDALSPDNVHEFLPKALRDRWIGADGSWLLRIEPRAADEPVLHPDRLGNFVNAVRAVAADVIGPPVQIYESGRLIQKSYITAALLAIPLVVLVLLLDFRSLADALCVLLPMIFGFVSMFGLMAIFGVPLNFANMIVLPITFGIAIDAGVHMVHRWRSDPLGQPPGLSGGTGRGITITVLTTLIGFACLLIAEHRGIRSLGFVVVAGQSAMLLACYTILPAVLALRTKPQMHTDGPG